MKKVIYYFTGTGNSMRAALKIAECVGDVEIISMRNEPSDVPAENCDMIGFIFPVYHWTVPEPAVRFIKELKINTSAYIFALAMPSFICGFACEHLQALLVEKGASLSYGEKVNSVANYALVYPPMPSPKLVVPKTEKKLERIALEIKQQIKKPFPRAGFMVRARYDKMMPPYKALQKYADYPFTISQSCISCGLCSRVCPCYNIELIDGKPNFLHHCAQCMACVAFCPKRAIGYELTPDNKLQLASNSSNTPITNLMGLPAKRKLYHNPYITAADIMKNSVKITKE